MKKCSAPAASVGRFCNLNAECDSSPGNGICSISAGFENVTIPYWKWTEPFPRHLNGPDNDGAGDNNFMGSMTGFFFNVAVWPVRTDPTNVSAGPRVLLGRNASAVGSINQTQIAAALAQPDYESFHPYWEGVHDNMHVSVGGELFDPSVAAEDPVFWLAHCYFDAVWAAWEIPHYPDYRPDTANFGDPYVPGDGNDADDEMQPWGDKTIRDVLNIADLGYAYDNPTQVKVVPTVSEWGLGALALLLLGGVALKFGRRRAAA